MKIENLRPKQIKKKIDQELDPDQEYNGNMRKVKTSEPTIKEMLTNLISVVNEIATKVNKNSEAIKKIIVKVDNNNSMIKQAHPELFKK